MSWITWATIEDNNAMFSIRTCGTSKDAPLLRGQSGKEEMHVFTTCLCRKAITQTQIFTNHPRADTSLATIQDFFWSAMDLMYCNRLQREFKITQNQQLHHSLSKVFHLPLSPCFQEFLSTWYFLIRTYFLQVINLISQCLSAWYSHLEQQSVVPINL